MAAAEPLGSFPSGSLSYGAREAAFREIGLTKGKPWSVDDMASAFRKGCPNLSKLRSDKEWLRMWDAFVVSYAERRANRADD